MVLAVGAIAMINDNSSNGHYLAPCVNFVVGIVIIVR